MEVIKNTGVIYTQVEDVPIEERVFFTEGIGVNANLNHFRPATQDEIDDFKEFESKLQFIND